MLMHIDRFFSALPYKTNKIMKEHQMISLLIFFCLLLLLKMLPFLMLSQPFVPLQLLYSIHLISYQQLLK